MKEPDNRSLKLATIDTTAGTQIRANIDVDAVAQYAEAMLESAAKFPPVIVYHDGSRYILADGFHRVMAASRNGFLDIEAEIRNGTKSDALKYALSANATHGLRRTNADKRRSVGLALAEWPKLSDREIARIAVAWFAMPSSRRFAKRQVPKAAKPAQEHTNNNSLCLSKIPSKSLSKKASKVWLGTREERRLVSRSITSFRDVVRSPDST